MIIYHTEFHAIVLGLRTWSIGTYVTHLSGLTRLGRLRLTKLKDL